jgi:hydrogenase assembly chaperone HypC/HupF
MMCFQTVGQVLAVPDEQPGTADVDFGGVVHSVSLVMLDVEGIRIRPGDWLLTHTGLAVQRLTESHARDLIEARREMQSALDDGAP